MHLPPPKTQPYAHTSQVGKAEYSKARCREPYESATWFLDYEDVRLTTAISASR